MSIQNCGSPTDQHSTLKQHSKQHSNTLEPKQHSNTLEPTLPNDFCIFCQTFRSTLINIQQFVSNLLDLYLEQYSTIINITQKCIVKLIEKSQHCLNRSILYMIYPIILDKISSNPYNKLKLVQCLVTWCNVYNDCTMTFSKRRHCTHCIPLYKLHEFKVFVSKLFPKCSQYTKQFCTILTNVDLFSNNFTINFLVLLTIIVGYCRRYKSRL